MADKYSLYLVEAMDRLWFQQVILFTEPIALISPKTLIMPHQPISQLPQHLATTSDSSLIAPRQDESSNVEEEDDAIKEKEKRRRLNRINGRTRWHSYSPSNQNQYRNQRCYVSVPRIQRTMSCKSLWELEFEEVKGFMDLGFTFKKGNLCPRMISLLPGLQRINRQKKEQENSESDEASKDDVDQYIEDEEDNEVNKGVMRPYLSEAWLINRPDSPLLNLRMPRVSKDMKSHLKFWARTVASVIQQES